MDWNSELCSKALLLCRHAGELSAQSATACGNGATDLLLDLQSGKETVIEELATLITGVDISSIPELFHAVELLHQALNAEMRALENSSSGVQDEIMRLNVAQKRLTQARRYDNAAQAPGSNGGGQLSACG